MNYVGINAGYHDAGITVLDKHGNILFAGHSERYSRIKNDSNLNLGIVQDAMQYVTGDIELHYYEKPWLKYLRQMKSGEPRSLRNLLAKNVIGRDIMFRLSDSPVITHKHHLSHAAAAFQTSPFKEATVVIADAIGEFDTMTVWQASYDASGDAQYKQLYHRAYPHSIGLLYSAMTDRIGLKAMEEEYILMGMAAYGKATYFSELMTEFIDDTTELRFKENLHVALPDSFLEGASKEDLACATQMVTEHLLGSLMSTARSLNDSNNLVYGGGVALNCLANRNLGIYFDNVWVMPNPGDCGSSLGAAALGYKKQLQWKNAFLGHKIPGRYPVNALTQTLLSSKIVGVASGRAEFGPRSLGHRSLLADPRGPDIKDKVNEIKQREQFRPFAPMILEEMAHQYFDMPRGWDTSRYMQVVAKCKRPDLFPAIVHVDGTSRVQTVPKGRTGVRHLLEHWYYETQCPMLLNTSLNIKGQPIVNTIEDAREFERLYQVPVLS